MAAAQAGADEINVLKVLLEALLVQSLRIRRFTFAGYGRQFLGRHQHGRSRRIEGAVHGNAAADSDNFGEVAVRIVSDDELSATNSGRCVASFNFEARVV